MGRNEFNMKKYTRKAAWQVFALLCLLYMLPTQPVLAAKSDDKTELSEPNSVAMDASDFDDLRYFVSLEGDDDMGLGTLEKPWQSIHKALLSIPMDEDDATIIIRGGTYKIPYTLSFDAQRGGSEGKFFSVTAYQNEEVIIDGSLLTERLSAMVTFSSTAYVRLKGLIFANLKGPKSGIIIDGTSHHIRIVNNTLRDMTWTEGAADKKILLPDDKLSPISVIGNHPIQAVTNIFVRGNALTNIAPGNSAGIEITGNVTNFLVSKNHISQIAGTGILASGNYPRIVDSSGIRIPSEVNHARNGVIRDNVIHNAVSPFANINSAGIALDGARYVVVKGNTSHNNDAGFSVGCKQPGDATGNIITRNIAYDNADAGLVVGTIYKDAIVNNTKVVNNEFRNNFVKGGHGGEMTIQSVNGLVVRDNLFSSRSDLMMVVSQPAASNLTLNNNLYHGVSNSAGAAVFDWSKIIGSSFVGLRNYQAATCNDLSSVYQDATTIAYFEKIKGKSKIKSGRNRGSKSTELREIKRACYKGNNIW